MGKNQLATMKENSGAKKATCDQAQRPQSVTELRFFFQLQKILIWALLTVGIVAGILAIFISARYPGEKPILLSQPETAVQQVADMMEAVCRGDYEEASAYILGTPDLGVAEQPENPVGVLLWDAFLENMEFALTGPCYTTDAGLAQDVSFTYLDTAGIMTDLKEQAEELLNRRVEEAEDVSEIYDENNEYRESVVMEVLQEAVQAAILEETRIVTITLTVNLKNQNGQWWVVADNPLLDAISGGAWN